MYVKPEKRLLKESRDVQYQGNTLDVWHLLRHRLGPTANLSQLGFETRLRQYRSFINGSRPKFDASCPKRVLDRVVSLPKLGRAPSAKEMPPFETYPRAATQR